MSKRADAMPDMGAIGQMWPIQAHNRGYDWSGIGGMTDLMDQQNLVVSNYCTRPRNCTVNGYFTHFIAPPSGHFIFKRTF